MVICNDINYDKSSLFLVRGVTITIFSSFLNHIKSLLHFIKPFHMVLIVSIELIHEIIIFYLVSPAYKRILKCYQLSDFAIDFMYLL